MFWMFSSFRVYPLVPLRFSTHLHDVFTDSEQHHNSVCVFLGVTTWVLMRPVARVEALLERGFRRASRLWWGAEFPLKWWIAQTAELGKPPVVARPNIIRHFLPLLNPAVVPSLHLFPRLLNYCWTHNPPPLCLSALLHLMVHLCHIAVFLQQLLRTPNPL